MIDSEEIECIHLLARATCTLCNGRAARERRDATTIDARFSARYGGTCFTCYEEIEPGETIVRLRSGAYAHDACWPPVSRC